MILRNRGFEKAPFSEPVTYGYVYKKWHGNNLF